jgi:hypothetical protein
VGSSPQTLPDSSSSHHSAAHSLPQAATLQIVAFRSAKRAPRILIGEHLNHPTFCDQSKNAPDLAHGHQENSG